VIDSHMALDPVSFFGCVSARVTVQIRDSGSGVQCLRPGSPAKMTGLGLALMKAVED
jgi:hypothetical protein